jgi:hypothetical protein
VNAEKKRVYPRPVLDADSFQRLLAAAFVLQSHSKQSSQAIAALPQPSFGAGAIVQKRTSSRRLPVYRRLFPFRTRARASGTSSVSRVTCWRCLETFAIGGVFCMMLATSIHRLAALPAGSASLSSRFAEDRDIDEPSGQSPSVSESSHRLLSVRVSGERLVGPEAVVQNSTAAELAAKGAFGNQMQLQMLPARRASAPLVRLAVNRNAGVPDKVIRYGDDVTMWKENPKAAARDPQVR